MKLRNKKTGQVGTFIISKDHFKCVDLSCVPFYFSLSGLLDEWEDAEDISVPNMPLIKDEKIRKAVKVWAEANNVLEVFAERVGDGTYMTLLELYDEDDERRRISVPSAFSPAGMKAGEAYTIAELCGEEEE